MKFDDKIHISKSEVAWLSPKLIKKDDRKAQYLDTHNAFNEGKLNVENYEWTVTACIRNTTEEKLSKAEYKALPKYWLLVNDFNNAIIIKDRFVYTGFDFSDLTISSALSLKTGLGFSSYNLSPKKTYDDYKITICGPHTILRRQKETYKTVLKDGDIMDREKAVMLLCLKNFGIEYSDITTMVKNAKVFSHPSELDIGDE